MAINTKQSQIQPTFTRFMSWHGCVIKKLWSLKMTCRIAKTTEHFDCHQKQRKSREKLPIFCRWLLNTTSSTGHHLNLIVGIAFIQVHPRLSSLTYYRSNPHAPLTNNCSTSLSSKPDRHLQQHLDFI